MVEGRTHDVPASVAAFSRRLSPRARAAMAQWEWAVHEKRRLPREELLRRLAEKGIPEWPSLWPLEEAFAGVVVRIGWEDLEIGIASALPYVERASLVDERGEIAFAPLGEWGNDTLLLDASGQLHLLVEPDQITLLEPSFESFLESQAMTTSFAAWAPARLSALLSPPAVAPALAAERAIPPVVEASNELHRFWQDDTLTLAESGEGPATLWAKTLAGLVDAIDAADRLCPALELRPRPSYEDEDREVMEPAEVRARAPSLESLRARPGARRFPLIGEPSLYDGRPPSSGDVWISGAGATLQIEVLERRAGDVVNYWKLTPSGSHALLMSHYGRG